MSDTINIVAKECDEGYYIPDDDITSENCLNCSLKRSAKCKRTYGYNECIDCGNFVGVYNGDKIIKCNETCVVGYKLVNNTCRPDFFINATFQASKGATIDLFSSGFTSYITQMYVDEEMIIPTPQFQFENSGNHTVYLKISKAGDSILSLQSGLFYK